ncbi:MAG: S41 family peptidase, partial [Anaerolineae bacterium]
GGTVAGSGSVWLGRTEFDDFLPVGGHRVAAEVEEFGVFWEVWDVVEDEFDGPLPSSREVTYGAIRGMVGALEDPNTFFSEPADREIERGRLEGHYGGIGIEDPSDLDFGPAEPVVRRVRPGSPADRSGIGPGDVLVQAEGILLAHLSESQVIALLRGPVGTELSLVVRRDRLVILSLRRESIGSPTVAGELLEEGVGYLSISFFGEQTVAEVRAALANLAGARGLILDLRDAPGGIVEAAVGVADLFLDGGPIFIQRDAGGDERLFRARSGGPAEDFELVVLVNGGTASAAEILAGAFQDLGRATLVGERTFGKGSVQRIHQLSDGSSIHVTVSVWLTPDRREIEGAGLSPDLVVPSPGEDSDEDPALDSALAMLSGS